MAGAPVLGHHFFPRESGAPISITGTVARFEMRNPHSLIVLEVRDASGTRDRPRAGPVPDREFGLAHPAVAKPRHVDDVEEEHAAFAPGF
jgi:hypothetical protein